MDNLEFLMEKFEESQLILFELYSESKQKGNNKNHEIIPPNFGKAKIDKISKQNDKDKEIGNEFDEELFKLNDKLNRMKRRKMKLLGKIQKTTDKFPEARRLVDNRCVHLVQFKDRLERAKLGEKVERSVDEIAVLKLSHHKQKQIKRMFDKWQKYVDKIINPCLQGMRNEHAASKHEI